MKNLESENSQLKTVTRKDENVHKATCNCMGDSIIKDVNGRMMSRENNVKIHCFPGSTTEDYDRFCEATSGEEPKSFHISCRYERFIL